MAVPKDVETVVYELRSKTCESAAKFILPHVMWLQGPRSTRYGRSFFLGIQSHIERSLLERHTLALRVLQPLVIVLDIAE